MPLPYVLPRKIWSFCAKWCGKQKGPQNWEALGPGLLAVQAWLTPEIRYSPNVLPAEFGRSRSNGTSVVKEIRLKNSTPRVLTQIDQRHMTSY